MKTTIEIPDPLFRKAKSRAAERGQTLRAFVADALVGQAALQRLGPASVDLVVTDVPYGWRSFWQSTPSQSVADDVDPLESLLAMLLPLLTPGAIVGVISDKTRKTQHESFKRVKQFTIGKRRVTLYTGL